MITSASTVTVTKPLKIAAMAFVGYITVLISFFNIIT
jgi:hypothetical protein